ncbi:MAG: hypothetical protein R3F46_15100 [bacterium]
MKQGWIAAFREARLSPLLELWQLQEQRRMAGRSRWLSSPGLLLAALCLGPLLSLMLVRQLLAINAAWQAGGMNPLQASAVFWLAVNGSLKLGLILLALFCLARLYRALADSGNLLNGSGRGRVFLDGGLGSSPLSSREIIAAQHIANLRLVLPAVAMLSLLMALHRLAGSIGLPDNQLPTMSWLAVNFLLLPLLSCLLSTVALLILGGIAIGNGAHGGPLPLQLGGFALLIPVQLALAISNYPMFENFRYNSIEDMLDPLAVLPAMLLPAILFISVAAAISSSGWRRVLAAGFGLLPVSVILGVALLGERLQQLNYLGWEWSYACSSWMFLVSRSICILPVLLDAMLIGGAFERPDDYGLWLIPGMPLLGILITQWLLLRISLHYSLRMLEQQRSHGEIRHASRPARSRLRLSPGLARALDIGFAWILLGLPILLAMASVIWARLIPAPRIQAEDELQRWLLDNLAEVQYLTAWQPGEREYSCWSSIDGLFDGGYGWGRDLDLSALDQLLKLTRESLADSAPGMADERLVTLLYLGMENQHWNTEYQYYWQLHGLRLAMLDQFSPETDNSLLLQFRAESLLQSLQWQEDYQNSTLWTGVFSTDPDSPMFAGTWLEDEDFRVLAALYEQEHAALEPGTYALIREIQLLLACTEFERLDACLQLYAREPRPTGEILALEAMGMQAIPELDAQSQRILRLLDDSYMDLPDLNPQIMLDASRFYIAYGRLDAMQRLHDYWWDISGLTGLDTVLTADETMLDALPLAVRQDPANAQFGRLHKEIRNHRNYGTFSVWTYQQWGAFWSEETLRYIENSLSFGRVTPTQLSQPFWQVVESRSLVEPFLQDADRRFLLELESLDWTSLQLATEAVEEQP